MEFRGLSLLKEGLKWFCWMFLIARRGFFSFLSQFLFLEGSSKWSVQICKLTNSYLQSKEGFRRVVWFAYHSVCLIFIVSWGSVKCEFKGTVRWDFLPLNFLEKGSSQAPYSVSEGFSNLTSNSRRYSWFLFTPYYCLERRADTPYIVLYRELWLPTSFIAGTNVWSTSRNSGLTVTMESPKSRFI